MPDDDSPPIADSGAPDRLVDDMKVFLRGGPIPDTTADGPDGPRDLTQSWDHGGATADPGGWTPSPAGEDTAVGRVIGPYRVIRFVAHGGMGDVYHARHRVLPREVALKTIRARLAGDPGVLERFEVEAKAVENLHHPHVVKLFEFDKHEGEPYLAMEWVPGGDLSDRLAAGPLPPREAARLVRAVAAAMAFAHGCGVLHRDLKPRNVLLTADGTPKVADFGLARLRTDDATGGLTQTGAIMGTPAYMAPEQAGGHAADVRTDVYAIGAILYELLTAAPPFRGDSKDAVLKQVRESDPPRPSSLAAGLPADLESICLRCLSKDATDRYQTAGDLVADLDRFLAGEPLPRSPWRRLRRAARAVRKRWRWAAAAAGVAGTAAATVLVMLALNRPPDGESAVVRQSLEDELKAGRPVQLVGATGWPKWFRWRAGAAPDRRVYLAADGFAAAESPDDHATALLELLPDTTADRYKVTAKLRHDWSKRAGRVGVYVAHAAAPTDAGDVQTFAVVESNGVVGHPGFGVVTAGKLRELVPANTSTVDVGTTVLADRGDSTQLQYVVAGLRISQLTGRGERSGHWHEIELTVTPEGVTASFDGTGRTLPWADTREKAPARCQSIRASQPLDATRLRTVPDFGPRGGVGILVNRGGVSLRDMTVTRLPE